MLETVMVWSLSESLPEFKKSNDNIGDVIYEYHKFNERSYSKPLKNIIDEVYYDLNVPMDIINLITIFNHGGIIYNYSKRFSQFTQNTIYITPIIFGYIETILFVLILLLTIITVNALRHNDSNISSFFKSTLVLLSLYAILLLIHGICALIAYQKCKSYEHIIRNFKRALYKNDHFINYILNDRLITDDAEINDDEKLDDNDDNNDNNDLLARNQRREMEIYDNKEEEHDWHFMSIYNNDENEDELLLTILNPSNNTFAWIAYQRWSNVKMLELRDDEFTRSKAALCLSLSKYWFPSYSILSFLISIHTPGIIISITLIILYLHSFYILIYCYLRVIANLSKRLSLILIFIFTITQDIVIGVVIFVMFTTDKNKDGTADTNTGKTILFWILDVILPIFFILCIIVFSKEVIKTLWNIIKYNRDINNYGYRLWLISIMLSGYIWFLLLIPSWRFIEISFVVIGVMVIFLYLIIQQICHRIMTGMNVKNYAKKYIASNPQKWLKQELKLIFIPYIGYF